MTEPLGPFGSLMIALACVAASAAVRLALAPVYGGSVAFMPFLPAVIVAALWGGRLASVSTLLLCVPTGWLLTVAGSGPAVDLELGVLRTVVFLVVGGFVVVVSGSLRRNLRVLNRKVQEVENAKDDLADLQVELQAMIDQAAAGIAKCDLAGRILSANDRFCEIVGRAEAEIVGETTAPFTHPDDIGPSAQVIAGVRTGGGDTRLEKRYIRPDGSTVWCLATARLAVDEAGEPQAVMAVIVDISEAKAVEAALRESEERFRAIADTAPVMIWVTGTDRKRQFVNQAYVDFATGVYETAARLDWRETIHEDDVDRVVAESLAGEATRRPFAMEARYRRRDGVHRWLRSYSRPRFGWDDEVVGFVGVAFDVTDAKQAEEDLKGINELLEERVGLALTEKAKAEADLMHAQRMEAVGRLTGGVAHDFNNLLTVVIGALDMVQRSDNPARRDKLVDAALSAARRGERLTQQLLAFSRRQTLRPETIDLNAFIREAEPLLRQAVGEAVTLSLKLRKSPARVRADPSQFEAALINLLVNARDAVKDGGSIAIETRRCALAEGEVTDGAAGDYVCVIVRDDGAGMDPAILDRVFEPFFTTKSVGKGTGLGLSQVYGFARQSGGTVKIESEPAKGTLVHIYLPELSRTSPSPRVEDPPPRTAAAAAAAPATGRRLLLVEDDEAVSEVASNLLESFGLEVECAANGAEALRRLESAAYDLMLTDIVMPGGMSGIELARQASDRWPDMRIILSSGYAGDDVDIAVEEAPWPFLQKPYSVDELRQRIAAAIPLEEPAELA